jgi:hypothetical protein
VLEGMGNIEIALLWSCSSLAWCSAVQQIEAENLEVVGEVAGSSPAGAV